MKDTLENAIRTLKAYHESDPWTLWWLEIIERELRELTVSLERGELTVKEDIPHKD